MGFSKLASSFLVLTAVTQLSFVRHLHKQVGFSGVNDKHYLKTKEVKQIVTDGFPGEYTLWSKRETFFEHCRRHIIGNGTWAKPLGPLVDKVQAKELVQAMGVEGLKIPRTLAVYHTSDYTGFSLENMLSLPQPYIIKPAHASGGVAKVENNSYSCFKHCIDGSRARDLTQEQEGKRVVQLNQRQMRTDLDRDFSKKHGELQYKDIPHRIIVEENVMVGNITSDVTYFYCAGGKPLFVSMQCDAAKRGAPGTSTARVFLSADYQRLHLKLKKKPCAELPPKPKTWDRQIEIVTKLAEKLGNISVRIDLYSGGNDIFFSEFTFTTGNCGPKMSFQPRIADGLLYAAENNFIDTTALTPQHIHNIIENKPWHLVSMRNGIHLLPDQAGAFQSPVDMCAAVKTERVYKHDDWEEQTTVQKCLGSAKEMASNSFRCMVNDLDANGIKAIGAQKEITLAAIIDRVDYGRALTLLVIVCFLTYHNIGTKHQPNQYLNNFIYLIAMGVVLFLTLPEVKGVYSGIPITTIVREAFETFKIVHPMESPFICISHFLTYWFKLASWRSKSLRNLLFFQLLVETISAFFNEWAHLTEKQPQIRCMRLAFIGAVKNYALDNIIREYVMPPFYVYMWLLPKFIWYWVSSGVEWVLSFLV